MCVMVYISSNKILPSISNNEVLLGLSIRELNVSDFGYDGVRKFLDSQFLYRANAHTGCGCGFNYGINEVLDDYDLEEEANGRNSVNQLFQYLKDNIGPNEVVELYSCLAGTEGNPIVNKYEINIKQFEPGDKFNFKYDELRIIKG